MSDDTLTFPPAATPPDREVALRPPIAPLLSSPLSPQSPSLSPRLTRAQLTTHLTTPTPWSTLPDATPLFLTPSGKDLFERLTGVTQPFLPLHDRIFLWCCTRTASELDCIWSTAPPVSASDLDSITVPAIHQLPHLTAEAIRWADTRFSAGAEKEIATLAALVWDHEHETLLLPDRAGLDESDWSPDEKKSLLANRIGWWRQLALLQATTLPAGLHSSTTHPSAPSSPPTEPGSTTTAGPPSPPEV